MCKICDITDNKREARILYEDAAVMAVLADEPTIFSHIWVFPKQHYKTLEEMPNDMLKQLFCVASTAATAVFESIGAEGTNMFICNGDHSSQKFPHLIIDVIPRKKNDGINFQWEPKKLSPEEMDNAKEKISDRISIPQEIGEKKKAVEKPLQEEIVYEGEDNYLVRHLRRIP